VQVPYTWVLLTWLSLTQVLAENKGGTVRDSSKGLSEAKVEPKARATTGSGNMEPKTMGRQTETEYKAQSPGKSEGNDRRFID